jgi:hypothetical protein
VPIGFWSPDGFAAIQKMATVLAASELIPKAFRGKVPNVIIALELAQRTGAGALAVMQSLNVIHGRPSWSAQFIIAAINSTGKFTPLRFRLTEPGPEETVSVTLTEYDDNGNKSKQTYSEKIRNRECVCYAKDKSGEILESAPVSIKMAVLEGWYSKSGSKWKTMEEVMLKYRSASFFGKVYAPEILMGMVTDDEAIDITPEEKDITPATGAPEKTSDPGKGVQGLKDALNKEKEQPKADPAAAGTTGEPADKKPGEGLPFGDPADDVPKEASGIPAYMWKAISVADADARWGKIENLLPTNNEKVKKAYEKVYADVLKKLSGGA